VSHSGALEAVDRILNRGGPAGEVVPAVLQALHERLYSSLVVAAPGGEAPLCVPIVWRGRRVAELQATPRRPSPDDLPLLERVELLLSAHVHDLDVGASPVRCPM